MIGDCNKLLNHATAVGLTVRMLAIGGARFLEGWIVLIVIVVAW
jgi:hypothetical protein